MNHVTALFILLNYLKFIGLVFCECERQAEGVRSIRYVRPFWLQTGKLHTYCRHPAMKMNQNPLRTQAMLDHA